MLISLIRRPSPIGCTLIKSDSSIFGAQTKEAASGRGTTASKDVVQRDANNATTALVQFLQ